MTGVIGMKELFLETKFGTVFGKSAGQEGRPLLLGIHGWSQRNGWHTWKPLLEPLARADYWMVSVDMPGWGQSAPAAGTEVTGTPVEHIMSMLAVLQVETAVLLGKSWGGGVAIETALQYPERITKLILTAPAWRNVDRLPELKQPVLLAWAEDDPVIPYQQAAQYVAKIPDIQLETYPTGGHEAAQHNVADFAPKAIQFLRD